MTKIKNILKKIIKLTKIAILISLLAVLLLQIFINLKTKNYIFDNIENVPESEYALVLGCGVQNNSPSPILKNRLDAALELYKNKKISKFIISGYRESQYYDEISVMKTYLTNHDIPEEIILEDKAGDNTYYSMLNYKNNFDEESLIVVSQKWHLKRAIFLSKGLKTKNVNAFVAKNCNSQSTTFYLKLREIPASFKAILDLNGIHLD